MQRLSATSIFPSYWPSSPWFWLLAIPVVLVAWYVSAWFELVLLAIVLVLYRQRLLSRQAGSNLLDEVWLDGDELVAVNRGERFRIALTDISKVNWTDVSDTEGPLSQGSIFSRIPSPPIVTLTLRKEVVGLGQEVSFIAIQQQNDVSAGNRPGLSGALSVATELMARIEALRQKSA